MSAVQRPAPDADPYLHYLAGLVHGLELRIDGAEAAIGELRMRSAALERAYTAVAHNTNNHEQVLRTLNEQLLDVVALVRDIERKVLES